MQTTTTTSFSQYLSRLVNQIDTEQAGLIRRLRVFQSDWLPKGTFYPPGDDGLQLPASSAARKLHDDGTDSVFIPFTLRSHDSLEKILADSEAVARWQSGVCSFTRMVLPIMERIDAQFVRYNEHIKVSSRADMLMANVQHIGVAYKAIKHELNEAIQKFSVCRDEFLVSLKVDEDRTTAKEALRFLYGKIEDWFARLEELSRFCRSESTGLHFADLLAPKTNTLIDSLGVRISQWEENGSFLVKLENVGNNRIELAEALFTMPETEVRSNNNASSQKQRQKPNHSDVDDNNNDANDNENATASSSLSSSSSSSSTSNNNDNNSANLPQTPTRTPMDWTSDDPRKWVDMVKINRILTPYPVRVQNLRRKITDEIERASFHPEPSFICFSFARNTIRSDNEDDEGNAGSPNDDNNENTDNNYNNDNNSANARNEDAMGFGDQYRDSDENAMVSGPVKGAAGHNRNLDDDNNDDDDNNAGMRMGEGTSTKASSRARDTNNSKNMDNNNNTGKGESSKASQSKSKSFEVIKSCMSTSFKIKILPS